jgi:hypothetical protein
MVGCSHGETKRRDGKAKVVIKLLNGETAESGARPPPPRHPLPSTRVADSHHFNADLDRAFHLNADSGRAFHFNADPDPAQSDAYLRPLVRKPS